MNTAAFSILFIGYFLTTGTEFFVSDIAKVAFRSLALLIFLANIVAQRSIRARYILVLLLLYSILALNQSQIAFNIVYLILISASMHRMSGKEVALSLLIPTVLVFGLHFVLLSTGQLSAQITEFSGRTRSTLGFTNANQASAIYLSLVILSVFTHIQYSKRASFFLMLFSYIMTLFVLLSTDSRTVMFALPLLLMFQIFGFLFFRFKSYRRLLILMGALTPLIGSLVTFYLATTSDPILNIILSLRPYFFALFIDSVSPYDFIFGWRPADNSGVDNLYLMLLSGVGAVGFFFIILSGSYFIFRMDPRIIPLVVVLLIISVFESFLLRPEIPISALFLHLLFSDLWRRQKSMQLSLPVVREATQ